MISAGNGIETIGWAATLDGLKEQLLRSIFTSNTELLHN